MKNMIKYILTCVIVYSFAQLITWWIYGDGGASTFIGWCAGVVAANLVRDYE